MANPEHVAIVRRGASVVTGWRRCNPAVKLDLAGVDFSGEYIDVTNLAGALMGEAVLVYTDFSLAILDGADLRGARLFATRFVHTELGGADLTGATVANCLFADIDLSHVVGLDQVRHVGPSIIGIDTLFKSKGKIPEVFLRGCGVPEIMIEYVRSLTGEALQFYTCFISFNEADDAFSERLYNDLQAKGVRCWRWKEDAPWGKTLMRSVDEAIRVYDKLIVICSDRSLKAEPVVREIERALQKEQRENKEVLFPIRLDDAVFSWRHELQTDVARKYIGDFTHWNSPASYSKALDRLIRDLRAEKPAAPV